MKSIREETAAMGQSVQRFTCRRICSKTTGPSDGIIVCPAVRTPNPGLLRPHGRNARTTRRFSRFSTNTNADTGTCPRNGESAVGAVCDRAYFVDLGRMTGSTTPLLIQEGRTRHQEEVAKRTGWSGAERKRLLALSLKKWNLLKSAIRNTSAIPTTY